MKLKLVVAYCPHCNEEYRVRQAVIGARSKCTRCGGAFTLTPAADQLLSSRKRALVLKRLSLLGYPLLIIAWFVCQNPVLLVGVAALFVCHLAFSYRTQKSTDLLPFRGPNELRISNPNPFSVLVELHLDDAVGTFPVPAHDVESAFVSNGRYDIYFRFSNEPNSVYQGNSLAISNNGIEIQIVKVAGGNYNIKRIE